MLTDLEIYTPRVFAPPLVSDSAKAFNDPLQIRDIKGLGPVAAALTSTPFGSIDGESYTGASVGRRNIVLTLGLNPDWSDGQTHFDLRQVGYRYFMPKNDITLKFKRSNLPDCEILGVVETVEVNHFSQNPELQVSILCPQPYFEDVSETVITGNTNLVSDTTHTDINYTGNVPTGFVLTVERGGTSYDDQIKVINYNLTTETWVADADIDTTYNLRMSTVAGDKYSQRVTKSTGVTLNTLGRVERLTEWPQLYPGPNEFVVESLLTDQIWTLCYKAKYGGL